MATKHADAPEAVQEGSRWLHAPPSGAQLAEWYRTNVPIAAPLDPQRYLPGITIIPNKEYVDRQIGDEIKRVPRMVYSPYPKVETRELYFWDFCEVRGYLGEIELQPVAKPRPDLPTGFFHQMLKDGAGKDVHMIGVSYRVLIWEPSLRAGGKGRPVRLPAAGTKMVPLLRKGYNGMLTPDENAIHKAQTGAIGRALGYAGMLIVPGAGIATAEDMQEFAGEPAAAPELPAVEAPAAAPADLVELVNALTVRLESDFPAAFEEAVAWAREKGYDLADPPPAALRGLEKQLRAKLERAEKGA